MTDLEMAAHKDYVEKLAASERENDRLRALLEQISLDLEQLQRMLAKQRERLKEQ